MNLSVNFPLILVLATAFTGAVWLLDYLLLRGRREQATQASEEAVKPSTLVEYSISFFPVLAIVLVLRSFIFEPFQIPTGSMIPTLQVGDFIVVSKFAYGLRLPVVGTKVMEVGEPENGDVMVFIPPHEDEYFIKRVVGVPGDRVRYQNKTLYINDERQEQTFVGQFPVDKPDYLVYEERLGDEVHRIRRNPYRDARIQEWIVPEGYYFMMGDNRDQSSDSRYWGFVSEQKIVGKAVAIWLHKEPGLNMPGFSRNGMIR